MKCAWQSLVNVLPVKFRDEIDKLGPENIMEIRFRLGANPELVMKEESIWLKEKSCSDDLTYVINAASRYSPWVSTTIRKGYITTPGGHRIGLCGDAVIQNGEMAGIRNPSSLCIRVAKDFPGIADRAKHLHGSILVIGKPGSGKTTLLRDLIRQRADFYNGCIAVVDERGELFPFVDGAPCFSLGKRTDVLSGCDKEHGIEALLRTMGPMCIAVDEITAQNDCKALMSVGWSGVSLLATAHAETVNDLRSRPIYKPLIESGLFDYLIMMQPDKTWVIERLCI